MAREMKYKRIVTCIIASLMFFCVLISAFFIAAEACHDCSGEDCPICEFVQQCENTLHQTGDGTAPIIALIMPVICMLLTAILFVPGISRETLVSRKVRLDN